MLALVLQIGLLYASRVAVVPMVLAPQALTKSVLMPKQAHAHGRTVRGLESMHERLRTGRVSQIRVCRGPADRNLLSIMIPLN